MKELTSLSSCKLFDDIECFDSYQDDPLLPGFNLLSRRNFLEQMLGQDNQILDVDDAIREGKRAVELLPVTKEAWVGLWRLEDLARVYTMVGEYDLAMEQLEYLLSIPGEISIPLLQLDPFWSPLRNHPRFIKLVESGTQAFQNGSK